LRLLGLSASEDLAVVTSIHCEICNLPHHVEAQVCERCGHRLGTPVDLPAMRREMTEFKRHVLLGVLALLAMLALNWFFLFPVGGVLLIAPLGWIFWGGAKYRHRSSFLRRVEASGQPRSP
jgi:hypothetical protein